MKRSHHVMASSIAVANLIALNALAQVPAAAPAPAAPPAEAAAAPAFEPAPAPAAPAAAPAAPAAPAAAPAAAPTGDSDHDAMVGHVAFGYLGFTNVPYGFMGEDNLGNDYGNQVAKAPVVGIRYWFNRSLGLDVGLGFTTTFGSNSATAGGATVSQDANAPTAMVVHGGLPIAFAAAKHYTLELIPEMNFGYAQMAITDGDKSGMHFDVGARIGTEIHFGFIGIPQLALQASVGLKIDVNQTKDETTTNGVTTKLSSSRAVIGTTVYDNPWNIFLGNVSALYYL